MRVLLLAAALLASPLLAGCLTAQATAMEYRVLADDAARLWDPNARLAGALGVEGNSLVARWAVSMLGASEEAPGNGGDDPNVGDGRAEAWAYRFVASGRSAAYVVVLDREGDVRRTYEEPGRGSETPLSAWNVDSDEALRLAKRANPGIDEGTQRATFGVLEALRMEDGRAVWLVLAGGHDEGAGGLGVVRIDATDGRVLGTMGGYGTR